MCKTLKILAFLLVIFAIMSLSACKKEEKEHKCEFKLDSVIMEQTCTDDGLMFYRCSCGETKFERQEASGHVYGEWNVISEATCSSVGTASRVCSVCSNEESTYTSKLTHSYTYTEEEVNGVLTTTYCCELCSDVFSISSTLIENFAGISAAYLTDCAEDFYFDVICAEGEDYIRENLRIFDSYYEGTEDENKEGVISEYDITNIDENVYRITPKSSYSAGETYKAVRTGGVVFKDYGLHDLTFSIFREETEIVEINEGVIFLQKLENNSPGYYPYTLEYSENSDTHWLTLKKVEGLSIGDVICVGNATNIDDVFNNLQAENTFGKISSIVYNKAENHYIISLETPKMSEIFDELDIHSSNIGDFESGEIDSDTALSEFKDALIHDEDFVNFVSASYVTTLEYLDDRGFTTTIASFKDFLDNIKIDETKSYGPELNADGEIIANIVINGSISIPVGMKNSTLGNIYIKFEAGIKLDYIKFSISCGSKEELENSEKEELTRFEVIADQSVTTSFSFDVEMRLDYSMEAKPYVLNNSTGVYHYASCKHVSAIKNLTYITAEDMFCMIADGEINANKECGTCKPVLAMKSEVYIYNRSTKTIHTYFCSSLNNISSENHVVTNADYQHLVSTGLKPCGNCHPESKVNNDFSEKLIENIQYKNFGQNIDEIREVASQLKKEASNNPKKIKLNKVSTMVSLFKLDFTVYAYAEFNLEASLEYNYKETVTSSYGVKLVAKQGLVPVAIGPNSNVKENNLTVSGKARVEVGIIAEAKLTFPGLEKKLYTALNAQIGAYAELHGVLQCDFVNAQNNYAAAYFEAGISCRVYVTVRIPLIVAKEKQIDVLKKQDIALIKKGYGAVAYDFVYYPEEIEITASKFSLNIDKIVSVKSYDLIDMKIITQKLSPTGSSGRYSVKFSLKSGSNCYIENRYLFVKDATKSFTDELTMTVTGYDTWKDYKSGNTMVLLPERTMKIVYTASSGSTGLEYELNSDGKSYAVVGIGTCTDKELVIPSTYNGKPVTTIGYLAFATTDSFTSIIIPSSVTTIGYGAFWKCVELAYVVIPNSVTTIGDWAFQSCYSLTSIDIPNSVTNIGKGAFYYCTALTKITIPNSVTSIGGLAFSFCSALTQITIPNSVTKIKDSAFYYCTALTKITIPTTVTYIGNDAFAYCTSLTQITIPNSVIEIGYGAFIGSAIEKINYSGTKANWKSIYTASEFSALLNKFVVYCTNGTLSASGSELS